MKSSSHAQTMPRQSMTRRSIRLSTSSSSSSATETSQCQSSMLIDVPPLHRHRHSGIIDNHHHHHHHRFVLHRMICMITMIMLVMIQLYYWNASVVISNTARSSYNEIEQDQQEQQQLTYIKNLSQLQQQHRSATTETIKTPNTYKNKMTTMTTTTATALSSTKPRIVQLQILSTLFDHTSTQSHNYNEDDSSFSKKAVFFPTQPNLLPLKDDDEGNNTDDEDSSIHQQRDPPTSYNFLKRLIPESCEYMEDWQSQLLTNCNQFHELDTINDKGQLLGNGWFRDAWKFHDHEHNHIIRNNKSNNKVVLKMLRLQQDFKPKRYERHRRDAMAMEHLTFSAYVLDIYGYCGQSAINEYATGIEVVNNIITNVEDNNNTTDGNNKKNITTTTTVTSLEGIGLLWQGLDNNKSKPTISTTSNTSTSMNTTSRIQSDRNDDSDEMWYMKFELGLNLAIGLVHIHYGQSSLLPSFWDDTQGQSSSPPSPQPKATLVHYDINPANIALMAGNKLKFNDFNLAEFMTTAKKKKRNTKEAIIDLDDKTTKSNSHSNTSSCGSFISKFHEPFWRAPEEVVDLTDTSRVNEKVDVFAIGNVMFQILTSHAPHNSELVGNDLEELRKNVSMGITPQLSPEYDSSEEEDVVVDKDDGHDRSSLRNMVIHCFRMAMDICFVTDPGRRGTAVDVANVFRTIAIQQDKSSLDPKHRYRLMKILEKTFP